MVHSYFRHIGSSLVLATIIACSIFPKPSGDIIKYILTPPSIAKLASKKTKKDLVVLPPSLPVVLQEDNRIVYKSSPQKVEYLANAEWAQKLDLMIWETLVASIKKSEKFRSVVINSSDALDNEYQVLKIAITSFHIEKSNTQYKARVGYAIETYLNHDQIKTRKTKSLSVNLDLKELELDQIVEKLNQAHHQIIQSTVNFV